MHFSFFLVDVKGQLGAPNSVRMVFIVFSRDSWGLQPINTHYIGLIGISHRGTLVQVHPTIP